ncbi:MAG: B12-binding domain-containing radical SAM protein [Deltaproteobacteria bacterium]|nr:B12-binding domain-containing radical SAM protein [Deltaproteobacteria bacterium]
MTVMTSRACPWKCTFCHNNMGKGYRPRSAENVVDELEALYRDVGIREIIFMDDMFNLHRERVRDICRGILSRGLDLKLTFPNGLRADIMDIETVKLLKEAGMYRCMYAIETGSPRLQKRIKKNVKLEKAKAIIAETAKLGVLTHGAFMLGFPTETEEEMQMTVDFACSTKLHTAAFYRVLPLPGSEIYSDVVSAGADVSGEIFDSPSQFEYHSSNVNLSTVDERFLTKIRKKAYLRFYLNPLRLPRLLWHLPNKLVMIPKLAKLFFLRAVQK